MLDPLVKLNVREVYGITKLYPANKAAELFCNIARTKTMTAETLTLVKYLGYTVEFDRLGFVA